MGLNDKAILGGDFFLQAFDFAVLELDNGAATRADQMVMVAFVGNVIVLRLGTEVSSLGNSRLAKQVQRAIDGGESKMGIFLRELMVHGFSRHVFLSQERRQDQFALARQLQLMLGQMLAKHIHLFKSLAHGA